jgi:threonine dehydratase
MDWRAAIEAAAVRIAPIVTRTPLICVPALAPDDRTEVWLKLESHQVTGSFKARGGANKLLSLSPEARSRGVVTASSGNHGAGTAHAAAQVGIPLTVFVPNHADPDKVQRIAAFGAQVHRFGEDCVETEAHARAVATQHGSTYISPYNDPDVVAGQGTIAVEILEQLPALNAVFVSIGGGGLISGIGSYLMAVKPGVQVVGCSPAASPAMHECMAAGQVVDVQCSETLSDATAGGVEPGAITLPLCQRCIDLSLLVDEPAIGAAMRAVVAHTSERIEGAAGVAVAGWQQVAHRFSGQRIAIVICGGNVSDATWDTVVSTDDIDR